MVDESQRSHTPLRRAFMVTASLVVATFAWFLVGESEKAIAKESQNADSGKVLATVGDRQITEAEVHEAAAAELAKIDRQRYDALANILDGKIREAMLEQEAAERELSVEALMAAEVEGKAAAIPEAEIDAFFAKNQGRIRGTKEQLGPQVRQHLAQTAFFQALDAKYDVTKNLEPYRVTVEATGPAKGPEDAPITIVEFSDFECPFCGRVNPTLKQVQETYGDKIRIVFRQYPLSFHPNAPKAAEASLCANDQGEFWAMHDALFANQKDLGVPALKAKAAAIEGVDTAAFDECLDSGKYAGQVQADMKAGSLAGVSGTPAFFINGRFLNGAQPFEAFQTIIDEELGS